MEDNSTEKVTMVTVAKQQSEPRHSKNESYKNKLGLSWAKLSHSWGLKLELEVEV